MNNFCGIGRLTREPELKENQTNNKYCRFTLAINNSYTNDKGEKVDDADFINCLCWNKTAENLCKYQKKGSQVAVTGRLHTYSYDGNDGQKKYDYDVIVSKLEYLDSKPKEERPTPEYTGPVEQKEENPFAMFGEANGTGIISDSDLPF